MDNRYRYQQEAKSALLDSFLKGGYSKSVLAAAPSAGKTTISHMVIEDYLNVFPNAQIVVLTHAQNILKDQYIESLKDPNVEISFEFGEFGSGKPVQIGIPQSINKLNLFTVDLLVVDECHEFYLQPMVQEIIKSLKPTHQLLLTGSPSQFNQKNDFFVYYISGIQLMKCGVFSGVDMDVVRVGHRNNTQKTLHQMISHAQNMGKNLSKIMIAVRDINEAKNAASYLESIGYRVAVSTSKNDRDNEAILDYRNNTKNALVVVRKAILGFSDNYITGLFDLRCSSDVEVSNQLFSRVLRQHPDDIFKFYYRCANPQKYNTEVIMLHKIKAFMRDDIFKHYDGANLEVKVA